MKEKNIVLEDVNSNEGVILSVMVEGEDLIKLKAYQQFLQEELNEEGIEHEINLNQVAMYIIQNELAKSVSIC